jgi:hypothetical protein
MSLNNSSSWPGSISVTSGAAEELCWTTSATSTSSQSQRISSRSSDSSERDSSRLTLASLSFSTRAAWA